MKRFLLPLLAALALPTAVNADIVEQLTPKEKTIGEIKAFYLCKIKEGKSKDKLNKDITNVFDTYELELKLLESKKVIEYSEFLVANKFVDFCKPFKEYYFFSEYMNAQFESGINDYKKLKPSEKNLLKIFLYADCKFRLGDFTAEETKAYILKNVTSLGEDKIEYHFKLAADRKMTKAVGYIFKKLNTKDCTFDKLD